MAARILPKTHFRDRIRQELARLGDDTLVVTDRGRTTAVLVSVQRWNALQETLEELQDAVAVFDHRAHPDATAPAERVFATIEAEEPDVPATGRPAV